MQNFLNWASSCPPPCLRGTQTDSTDSSLAGCAAGSGPAGSTCAVDDMCSEAVQKAVQRSMKGSEGTTKGSAEDSAKLSERRRKGSERSLKGSGKVKERQGKVSERQGQRAGSTTPKCRVDGSASPGIAEYSNGSAGHMTACRSPSTSS